MVCLSLVRALIECRFGGVLADRTLLVCVGTLISIVAFAAVGLAFEEVTIFVLESLASVIDLIFG